MKKLITIFAIIAVAAMLLVGCGEKEPAIASYVTINNTKITLGGAYDSMIADALGEPNTTEEAVSCHYEGFDTMYYYDGYTIYTYLLEEQKIMYSIEITDAAIKTPEGATVGMTVADVEKIYGTEHAELPNGISYALTGEGAKLNFRVKDNAVYCIEYYTE